MVKVSAQELGNECKMRKALHTKNVLHNDTDKMCNKYRFLKVTIAHSFSKYTKKLDSLHFTLLIQRFRNFFLVLLFCFFFQRWFVKRQKQHEIRKSTTNWQVNYIRPNGSSFQPIFYFCNIFFNFQKQQKLYQYTKMTQTYILQTIHKFLYYQTLITFWKDLCITDFITF